MFTDAKQHINREKQNLKKEGGKNKQKTTNYNTNYNSAFSILV